MTDTSTAAYAYIKPRRRGMKAQILEHIAKQGAKGSTCYECEHELRLKHQTCSARFSELKRDGEIVANGQKRQTDTCYAEVFVVKFVQRELF